MQFPLPLGVEADASRVECAANMEESIPDCSSVVRNTRGVVRILDMGGAKDIT